MIPFLVRLHSSLSLMATSGLRERFGRRTGAHRTPRKHNLLAVSLGLTESRRIFQGRGRPTVPPLRQPHQRRSRRGY